MVGSTKKLSNAFNTEKERNDETFEKTKQAVKKSKNEFEPRNIGDGWHGYTEYTYSVDETRCVILSDQAGFRDRENYLADKNNKKN